MTLGASRRRRDFGQGKNQPLHAPIILGVSSSSTGTGGGKSSKPAKTLAMLTLKTPSGISRLWNMRSFGFTIVAFPTATFWPLMS